MKGNRPTPEQAYQKIKQYCGYQERSHAEVKDKLYGMGLWKNDVEGLVSRLIDEDYLNEERFATHFAGGKFRMKQWGRIKIRYELKQKRVSEYCIRQAMREISEDDYQQAFEKLFARKLETLKSEKNLFIRKRRISDYLLQKGYEADMISRRVNQM